MKSLFTSALVSILVLTSSSAYALDARKDCSTLKQVIKDTKVNFKNIVADVPPMDVDVYPSKLTLTGSNSCRVVLRTNVSSVSWSCVIEDTTVKEVAAFVSKCIGKRETLDQTYQRVGAKVFRLKPQAPAEIVVSELDRGNIALQVKALQKK
ncbi:hypothetical protein [Pseudochrobactrum asaccharolyticum]|uniref:hypothetical protein n=1 Tax=Pseudochrobactrum asaccharolyticum TaxID=354351 RepID=UPI0040412A0B